MSPRPAPLTTTGAGPERAVRSHAWRYATPAARQAYDRCVTRTRLVAAVGSRRLGEVVGSVEDLKEPGVKPGVGADRLEDLRDGLSPWPQIERCTVKRSDRDTRLGEDDRGPDEVPESE